MDEIAKRSIGQAVISMKQPDQVMWEVDNPFPQPWYEWNADEREWQTGSDTKATDPVTALALYTWNIDFMLPFPQERMETALAHLCEVTKKQPHAVVIALQECTTSDIAIIRQSQWIRDNFYITDVDNSFWGSMIYGTTTMVDRRLAISSCFRVHFSMTKMKRDGLFVDIALSSTKIRLCNTHLESLVADPPLRPAEMELLAGYMRDVDGAVLLGDLNAIQPFDETLHTENGFKDAYLELGGPPDAEDGKTWGQQAHPRLREQFGCSRMDKVLFQGNALKLQTLERFGRDVVLKGALADRLIGLGFEKAWVTDHLGLHAVFGLQVRCCR